MQIVLPPEVEALVQRQLISGKYNSAIAYGTSKADRGYPCRCQTPFLNYRLALELNESDRKLYLAVPIAVHEALFQREFLQISVERYQINRTSK
jgi:hypothetical protein